MLQAHSHLTSSWEYTNNSTSKCSEVSSAWIGTPILSLAWLCEGPIILDVFPPPIKKGTRCIFTTALPWQQNYTYKTQGPQISALVSISKFSCYMMTDNFHSFMANVMTIRCFVIVRPQSSEQYRHRLSGYVQHRSGGGQNLAARWHCSKLSRADQEGMCQSSDKHTNLLVSTENVKIM